MSRVEMTKNGNCYSFQIRRNGAWVYGGHTFGKAEGLAMLAELRRRFDKPADVRPCDLCGAVADEERAHRDDCPRGVVR